MFAVLLVAALTLCSGCISADKTGSARSPDGKYVVYGHVQGASGHSYDADTAKTVFITVEPLEHGALTSVTNEQTGVVASEDVAARGNPDKPLVEKEYHIRGSGVCCDEVWGSDDSLTVVVYDYGPGVHWEDARKEGFPKRNILTLHYQLHSKPDLSMAGPAH